MKTNKILKISGTLLDKQQLERHLQKIASDHNIINKSEKETYPVPHLIESFKVIKEVYYLLNEHLKLGISIHPAGEWLLDNLYVIEETVKQIEKDLTIKKYQNLIGISNGTYKGFARIYVLAYEIVAYTDNKIDRKELEEYLKNYQKKKTLSMEEIWNVGTFLNIALIENIREICEKIYIAQIEKYKAENIVERLVENKSKGELKYKINPFKDIKKEVKEDIKYSFIEYMSYILKRYGKKGYSYLKILEETIEMKGITLSEVIKKEHFDIAVRKVSIGNSITSIKTIQRINFLEVFEKVNGVEELLKQDPSNVYEKMDTKTKEYYRAKIKEIANKTKISEIYITRKLLELANENIKGTKKNHIGYYLIDKGTNELYEKINYNKKKSISEKNKTIIFVLLTFFLSIILSLLITGTIYKTIKNIWILGISFILLLIPSSEIVIQITQNILNKMVKPKLIPKIDFQDGIDEENTTMVVIPTIVDSSKKVKELMRKLEVSYLANKSKNLYFTLLADCTTSDKENENYDSEIIEEGKKITKKLNNKYGDIFNFIYRKRIYNKKEGQYLGWERKRGMLNQFNEYLLNHIENPFLTNTLEEKEKPKIKYIITLDSDTDLVLNSAFKLVGAMSHILNKPIIDQNKNIVKNGYGIMQPRVGVNLDISYKNLFTKIFANDGGIDSYTNAISDIYQDNFKEGIYTGKGIYDLEIFSTVLKNQIPENMVLSHDLLEGCYLRCGLVSDIMLLDGYPSKYNSFINRLSRWIRGDWQITKWLGRKSPLNLLSKYKIFDNLRRSLLEINIVTAMIFGIIVGLIEKTNIKGIIGILTIISILPYLLEIINNIIFKKEGEQKLKNFTPKITGIKGAILRTIITLGCLPYKAYISFKSIIKTNYRKYISKKHLLEWTTSEEAEKQSKTDLKSYIKQMIINPIIGTISIVVSLFYLRCILLLILGILWLITPFIMWYISKENKKRKPIEELDKKEQEYVNEIGRKTWKYFETYLTKENNYLIPDNYQEDRREKIVTRTSSTNIGLSLLSVISAYDLGYINKEKSLELLKEIIFTIESLPKWNGHLYNWYEIRKKEPLIPRYVSTVDSGNLVGYLYVTKSFLNEVNLDNKEEQENLINIIDKIIKNTDFSLLYKWEQQIFSIGFNIEENKLTDSYYDLLASEARQASLIAIAKKDVPKEHWYHLSRTSTTLGKHKGLVSWSGTAFEYLMPNINIPKYPGSLLDESCKFLIYSQKEYSNKMRIPFGISETAFNMKDLKGNYQYKACGIPWIGLKRGLEDDIVISTYAGVLAINEIPKEIVKNLKRLEKEGMYNKYGFYEAIDYTPERVEKGKIASVVKTYMAHHQGLILLSINNLFNNEILQKRFMANPEMEAVNVLLQETMPEVTIISKENKEKVEKLKYKDYENYTIRNYNKINEKLITGNIISNENYVIAMNQKGEGVSKYKDIYVNRFKTTEDYSQGIFFTFKNIKDNKIWSSNYRDNKKREDNYKISFMPDCSEQEIIEGDIKTKIKTTVSSIAPVELRRIILENRGKEEKIIEVTSYFEPVLSKKEQDYAHPTFNNLFLVLKWNEENSSLIVKRKKRDEDEKEIFLEVTLSTNSETIGDIEYEIDEDKFIGRGNLGIPIMVENSIPLSKKIGLVTEPIVALKRTIKIQPQEESIIDFILSVGEEKEVVDENVKKYKISENVNTELELSKARVEAENRYLGIKGKEIDLYQKILSYIIFDNPIKSIKIKKSKYTYEQKELWKYGISGDLPIILVKLRNVNEGYIVDEVLKLYEYFRTKNIKTEIVILDEEKYSYENYVQEEIENAILNNRMGYLKNIKGGIFTLSKGEINHKDIELLDLISVITIDSNKGGLKNSIEELEEEYFEKYKEIENEENKQTIIQEDNEDIDILEKNEDILYYNEYGGFSKDGKEYLIKTNKTNRLPTVWSHIIANKKFGTVITENMGGYSWYKNSRLNRVSSWENNPCLDIPSEVIYIKDKENNSTWSLGLNPKPDNKNYNVVYGFGYAKYIHKSNGIEQNLEVFVPNEDSCKINIIHLKNTTQNKKKIKIYYYIKPTLGEEEQKINQYLLIEKDSNSNIITAKKIYKREEIENLIYISSSEKIKSYTGDKNFFLGTGGITNPEGLKKVKLNNDTGIGKKTCMAFEIEVELESYANKEITLTLGAEEKLIDCKNIAYKYSNINNAKQELRNVQKKWKEFLGRLQVYTPLESLNILLNGWIPYQTMTSRLLGRSGYYQSGGAYGFRDQLQDTLGLKYLDTELMKNQIIKHSKHQFKEGDVQHWWHDENNRGIRTKISDDLLWLVFVTIEYIKFTGDKTILNIETPYLQGDILHENEEEKYDKFIETKEKESIFKHCIKAIEKSLNFGENGLPKIGSGDWNDGFSNVGDKGKGESVWLGFFLYTILENFIPLCREKNEEELANKYEEIKRNLKKSLNTNGWDGRWYKRAFMDDGNILGSMENEECRIDSIAQSWSIISNAGDNDKKYISMESLENHLIDKENGIIKLLDPPFEKGKLEPGYIKAYLPGVRENGGQYTHGAVWVIIAEAILGFNEKALELYKMINPIEHSRTKEASQKYKVEPYVIAADIYGAQNLIGRGGWTWYTGSSSWYYKAGIEYILGLKIENEYMIIKPCIPKNWKEYQMQYKYKESIYNIHITNNNLEKEKNTIKINGIEKENKIKLDGKAQIYNIEIEI